MTTTAQLDALIRSTNLLITARRKPSDIVSDDVDRAHVLVGLEQLLTEVAHLAVTAGIPTGDACNHLEAAMTRISLTPLADQPALIAA